MKNSAEQGNFSEFDKKCMSRVISLARKGTGKTSPNPLVGAIIAKDGKIIGEGWHRQYKGKHAEQEAMDSVLAAGISPQGADLYCNLEPCCYTAPDKHQGPCTDLIIKSGIQRVVIANYDPNPKVNGEGVKILKKAGIKVETGLFAADGESLNEGFFTFQRLGRPFVRLKIAQSIDGRIAAAGGDSRWITDVAARQMVHRMRSRHDAVLIGRGTAMADDPELTVRLVRGPNPLRVVLDSRLSLPVSARLFSLPDRKKTMILCSHEADPEKISMLRNKGIQVLTINCEPNNDALSLQAVLAALAGYGIRSIFVEGGSAVFTAFLRQGLWDKLAVFIAPLVLGQGLNAVGDLGINAVKNALHLNDVSFKQIGEQMLLEASLVEAPFLEGGGPCLPE